MSRTSSSDTQHDFAGYGSLAQHAGSPGCGHRPYEHRDQLRDNDPKMLSQSLTGRASTSLGAARVRRGTMMHTQTTRPRSQPKPWRPPRPPSRPDRNGQPRPQRARGPIGHKTHPRPALSHSEASARGRRSWPPPPCAAQAHAKVWMMVARALMPLFAEFLRTTFELSTWPLIGGRQRARHADWNVPFSPVRRYGTQR
jgi:hypothetical protein